MLDANSNNSKVHSSIQKPYEKRSNASRTDLLERQIQKQVLLRKNQQKGKIGNDFLNDLKLPAVENSRGVGLDINSSNNRAKNIAERHR